MDIERTFSAINDWYATRITDRYDAEFAGEVQEVAVAAIPEDQREMAGPIFQTFGTDIQEKVGRGYMASRYLMADQGNPSELEALTGQDREVMEAVTVGNERIRSFYDSLNDSDLTSDTIEAAFVATYESAAQFAEDHLAMGRLVFYEATRPDKKSVLGLTAAPDAPLGGIFDGLRERKERAIQAMSVILDATIPLVFERVLGDLYK